MERLLSTKDGTLLEFTEMLTPPAFRVYTAQTDDEFESAFEGILEGILAGLEQNKLDFANDSEDKLSSTIVLAFNAAGLRAIREGNSNGHVDLTIEVGFCSPMKRKLGEAKIYNGPSYHLQGLQQLIGRYTTGRETRGVMIEYVKQADIAGLIKKIRERMDADLPMQQQGPTQDNGMRWSFISVHRLTSGDDHPVAHYGCNLY
jgi:hypothetical protein